MKVLIILLLLLQIKGVRINVNFFLYFLQFLGTWPKEKAGKATKAGMRMETKKG